MQFTGRTIILITNYIIKRLSLLENINSMEFINIILNSLKIIYWNSFQNREKLVEFKSNSIKNFQNVYENNNYIFENEEIENSYKELINIKKEIENSLKNNKKEFYFSFEYIIKLCKKIKIEDIDKNVRVLTEIINTTRKYYKIIDEELFNSIIRVNIIINLLKEIQQDKKIENFGDKTIVDLSEKENIKNINKIVFLSEILEHKKIFNIPYIYSITFLSNNSDIIELIGLIEIFVECKDNIVHNFKNIMKFLSNKQIFMKISRIFPFYKFENDELEKNIILWIPLFAQLYNKQYEFSIEFVDVNNNKLHLTFNNNNKNISPVFRFSEKYEELFLFSGLKINQFSEKTKVQGKPLEFNYKDKKGEKEKYTFIFYQIIFLILEQSIQIPYSQWMKKVFMSCNNNSIDKNLKEKLASLYYKNKNYDLNLLYKNQSNNFVYESKNIIGNIIGIFYSFPIEFIEFYYKYLNIEFSKIIFKELINKLMHLKNNNIKNIFRQYIDISEEINKFSFFFSFLEDKNNYKKKEDELNVLNKINNDLIIFEKLKILIPDIKEKIDEYLDIITKEQKKVEEIININKKHYIEKEIENKKYILEEKIDDIMKKNKENQCINDFLYILLKNLEQNKNLTIEYLNKIEKILEDFLSFQENQNKENINVIKFPKLNINKINDNDNDNNNKVITKLIKECFIFYSYKYKLIRKLIHNSNNKNDKIKYYKIIYDIYKLDDYKDYRDICKILFNRILNEIKIDSQLINKITNTLNSLTIIKMIEITKKYQKKSLRLSELPNFLLNINEKINSYAEYNEINNYDIILFNEVSNKYKYNFNLYLPKITPNDLIFLFCKLDENENLKKNTNYPDLCLNNFNGEEFVKIIKEFDEDKNHINCIKKISKEILESLEVNIDKNKDVKEILDELE